MKRDEFLATVKQEIESDKHKLFPWVRGKHGFYTHCMNCGAMASVVVSKKQVVERPDKACYANKRN